MQYGFLIIIIVAIIGFILDSLTNTCIRDSIQGAIVTFTHHFIFAFCVFGWLLDDPALLILFLIILPIIKLHWKVHTECFVDEVTTNVCGEPKPFQHLGTKVPLLFQRIISVSGITIAIYKLWWILTRRPRGPIRRIPPIWELRKNNKLA